MVGCQANWTTRLAYCIGCGRSRLLVGHDGVRGQHWLATDGRSIGVCVSCKDHLARWRAGDRGFAVEVDVATVSGLQRADGFASRKMRGLLSPSAGVWACPTCSGWGQDEDGCPTCADDGYLHDMIEQRAGSLGHVCVNDASVIVDSSGAAVRLLDVRDAGWEAGRSGNADSANRHDVGSVQWVAWQDGYDDGRSMRQC
jgi:hypothetical protein